MKSESGFSFAIASQPFEVFFCKVSKPNYCSTNKWECFGANSFSKHWKNTCEIVSPSKIIEDCLSINFPGYPENFPDHQKNIKSIRKLSRLSKNLTDHPENIQIIQKLSRLSGNFPGYPEIFRIIRKISSLSGNFPGYPETFQAIQKLSGQSGKYPAYPETFQIIRKLSGPSGKY